MLTVDLNLRMNLRLGTQLWRSCRSEPRLASEDAAPSKKKKKYTVSSEFKVEMWQNVAKCEVESILKHREEWVEELSWIETVLNLRFPQHLEFRNCWFFVVFAFFVNRTNCHRSWILWIWPSHTSFVPGSNLPQIYIFWSFFSTGLIWSFNMIMNLKGQVLLLPFRVRFCRADVALHNALRKIYLLV